MTTGERSDETQDQLVSIGCSAQTKGKLRRSLLLSTAGLVVAGALGAVMVLASSEASYAADSSPVPTMSSDMPGMDMGSGKPTPTPTPTPTPAPTPTEALIQGPDSGEMPGMDMSESTPHQHGDSSASSSSRPLAPVLGTFGGGTAAVMLTAGMVRRRDRDRLHIKEAARAARRSGK